MPARFVPHFLPSTAGFHFANDFPAQPILMLTVSGLGEVAIGDASRGVCGGMVFAARDFFEAKRPVPDVHEPPSVASPLFRYFVRRLFASFHLPRGPLRYFAWMCLSDVSVRRRTVLREWPRIKAQLDSGRLATLGLVKLRSKNPLIMGDNHQVLAYGYEQAASGGGVAIHVYDPNYPDHDAVTLSLDTADPMGTPICCSVGGTVRGFFLTPYRRARPRN